MRILHNVSAAALGRVTPTNDNARGQPGVVGEQESATNGDCANDGANLKALASMTARVALCGCTLHELSGGGYMLCRWGMSRELPCLRAVGDLLRRIGGCHG
jgi:hypothetical protein